MGDPRSGRRYKDFRAKVRAIHAMQGRPCSMPVCLFPSRTIDYRLQYPHPRAWSLEHVVSIARGGPTFDPSNTASAHLRCNLSAGAVAGNVKRRQKVLRDWGTDVVQTHTSTRW